MDEHCGVHQAAMDVPAKAEERVPLQQGAAAAHEAACRAMTNEAAGPATSRAAAAHLVVAAAELEYAKTHFDALCRLAVKRTDAAVVVALFGLGRSAAWSNTAEAAAERWAAHTRAGPNRLVGRRSTLTPTEARVASLVARGQTNQEVADALFMSPKTVEWNLSKVYRKLHVRSRTELAAKSARGASHTSA